ncbi:MAG TPA: hypothetical protein VHB50_05155 [Bryobacteraceae bacterium]|jgi:hypothetical protein|nr:hypothetical protein [Bryobacteraceae bacterium]
MSEETGQAHVHAHCICCEANEAIGKFFRNIGPSEDAAEHFRQSRIEFLKGIRRILDDRIERIGRTGRRGTHVVVE